MVMGHIGVRNPGHLLTVLKCDVALCDGALFRLVVGLPCELARSSSINAEGGR